MKKVQHMVGYKTCTAIKSGTLLANQNCDIFVDLHYCQYLTNEELFSHSDKPISYSQFKI